MLYYTPSETTKREEAPSCVLRERRERARVYLRVAFFSLIVGFGIFMVCAFFSLNIIIPPMKNHHLYIHNTQQLIPNFSLIVVSVDVSLSSTISAVFISILLLFNQLLILFFLSVHFFFFFGAKSFTNFYSLFIRVRTTTAKSCSPAVACRCLSLTDFCDGFEGKFFA